MPKSNINKTANNLIKSIEKVLKQSGGKHGYGYSIDPSHEIGRQPVVNSYESGKGPVFNTLSGGDGYSVNPEEAIAGNPVISRYGYNDLPQFKNLNGGDGFSVDVYKNIAGHPEYLRYDNAKPPVYNGELTGGDLQVAIKSAVATMSKFLAPLTKSKLASVILLFILNKYMTGGYKKQSGGMDMSKFLPPLTQLNKTNLIVIASLLMLNHLLKKNNKTKKGGEPLMTSLSDILMPLGKSKFTSTAILAGLNSLKSKKTQKGGMPIFNQLVDITKTLTSKEFLVPGLLVYLNKLMSEDVKSSKSKSKTKKGGNVISNLLQTIVSLVMPFGGINQAVATGSLIAVSSYDYNMKSSKKGKK